MSSTCERIHTELFYLLIWEGELIFGISQYTNTDNVRLVTPTKQIVRRHMRPPRWPRMLVISWAVHLTTFPKVCEINIVGLVGRWSCGPSENFPEGSLDRNCQSHGLLVSQTVAFALSTNSL